MEWPSLQHYQSGCHLGHNRGPEKRGGEGRGGEGREGEERRGDVRRKRLIRKFQFLIPEYEADLIMHEAHMLNNH